MGWSSRMAISAPPFSCDQQRWGSDRSRCQLPDNRFTIVSGSSLRKLIPIVFTKRRKVRRIVFPKTLPSFACFVSRSLNCQSVPHVHFIFFVFLMEVLVPVTPGLPLARREIHPMCHRMHKRRLADPEERRPAPSGVVRDFLPTCPSHSRIRQGSGSAHGSVFAICLLLPSAC